MGEQNTKEKKRDVLWLRLAGLAVLGLLLVRLIACQASEVEAAEQRWQRARIESYRIQLQEFHSVWCYYDVNVEVLKGQVVSARITAHRGPAGACGFYDEGAVEEPVALAPEKAAQWTVPELLAKARELSGHRHSSDWDVEIELDPELGYPRRLALDHKQAKDDDWWINVSQLEAINP